MIKGTPYWNDPYRYYTQVNNALEEVLRRYKAEESAVTCGPTTAINCLASIGAEIDTLTPAGWSPQPEDVLTLWFHDQRNWPVLSEVRKETRPDDTKYSPHEVPQYYPTAVKEVFGVECVFRWIFDFQEIADIVSSGRAVQIAKKKPGHYIAVVAYDDFTEQLIINDPYPQFYVNNNGFNQHLSKHEYSFNIQPYAIIYGEGK
ncbi:C39 family peptidase [Marispirochaeta aestuarii]|uniref:C39 family peptidase n=1 Tax=Marispirochaeta aestuarii TaxID=1963862 RepID=UPI001301C6B1|nr:C39 family peptidase [Marispirochaeta aestuarii]